MAVVTMRQLLESGVHFGHQTRRWNPKMKRFILTERNGIYIIDLEKTVEDIDRTFDFVKETVAHGGTILFVGTKKQAQEAISEEATRVGMPYVTERWLGGMLTNFSTVHGRLQRLKELEQIDFDDVAGSDRTKKELLMMRREKEKLERTLGGIRNMNKVPSAVWIVDTNKEHLAVAEAKKLGLPVVAVVDTNCDPDDVDYRIPGNDDAIRSVALLTRVIADAVAEGRIARAGGGEQAGEEEPMPEWEREMLAQADAHDEAVAQKEASAGEAPADAETAAPAAAEADAKEDTPAVMGDNPAEGAPLEPGTDEAQAAGVTEEAPLAEAAEGTPAPEVPAEQSTPEESGEAPAEGAPLEPGTEEADAAGVTESETDETTQAKA